VPRLLRNARARSVSVAAFFTPTILPKASTDGGHRQLDVVAVIGRVQHDGSALHGLGQGRISGAGEAAENRHVGERREQAPREHDAFATDPVGQAAKEEEERRAINSEQATSR